MSLVCFYIGNTSDSLYPLDPVGFEAEGRLCATSSVFTTFAHNIHSTAWFSVRCAPPCTTFGFEAKGNSREHVGSSHRFVVHSYSACSWKSRWKSCESELDKCADHKFRWQFHTTETPYEPVWQPDRYFTKTYTSVDLVFRSFIKCDSNRMGYGTIKAFNKNKNERLPRRRRPNHRGN